VQTPIIVDEIESEINFVKDAVVNNKLIGVLENYIERASNLEINKVHYIDLNTKNVYSYDFGSEKVYGLFGYNDFLYVFTETKVYFIRQDTITSKVHGFRLRGFDLVNPYTFIVLDVSDVPTVLLFSLSELFRFQDEVNYQFVKSDFASVYLPSEWFDYNNLIFKDGKVYVRGKDGLSVLKLDYVGTYGVLFSVEEIFNTYKPIFQKELYEQGVNLLQFFAKVNNSVYWFQHEKTGRNVFLIDDYFVLGDAGIVFDRNWFFDFVDKKFYRYSFSSELGSWVSYDKCFLSINLNQGGVFRGLEYEVFESRGQYFDCLVVALLRLAERGFRFKLNVDKKSFMCNIYGESFVVNLFFNDRMRMKIKEIKVDKEG
jgi:hypothetical protein